MTAIIRKVTQIGLGDNADPTKNFIIRVPDIADGTLKITRGDGTAVLNIDAAGKAVFPGNAQTLQDVKASRAAATPYQNLTGQTITVIAAIRSSATASTAVITIDGKSFNGSGQSPANYVVGVTFPVPAGSTYSLTMDTGTPTLNSWMELR